MKKIMFNDKYGLTQAVLEGRKTRTRRVIKSLNDAYNIDSIEVGIDGKGKIYFTPYIEGKPTQDIYPLYQLEDVAIAQTYRDVNCECKVKGIEPICFYGGKISNTNKQGWRNKMFVKAVLMPHLIRITNIRVERLQDISEDDCLKEGFAKINVNNGVGNMLSHWEYLLMYEDKLGRSLRLGSRDHKEAFEILIDKTCGKGTWESNPWVFVYDFELVK